MNYPRVQPLRSESFRYDATLGLGAECVAFRVTLEELESIAQKKGAWILWDCAHRVGLNIVEVPMANRQYPCTFFDQY